MALGIRKYFYLFALVVFISCKKNINIPIPTQPNQLVVNSNFKLDSALQVFLSLSQPSNSNGNLTPYQQATLGIYTADSILIEPLTQMGNYYFSTLFKPISNTLYRLRISTPTQEYWASDSVPNYPNTSIVDTSTIVFQGNNHFFRIEYKLKDTANQKNYYALMLKRNYMQLVPKANTTQMDTLYKSEWLPIETNDFYLTENPESSYSKSYLLFTDRHFNGLSLVLKFGSSKLKDNISNQLTLNTVVYCQQLSAQAYNYYQSINEHLFYQNDPYSQPNAIKGNIANALGAFVGVSQVADTVFFSH